MRSSIAIYDFIMHGYKIKESPPIADLGDDRRIRPRRGNYITVVSLYNNKTYTFSYQTWTDMWNYLNDAPMERSYLASLL